MPEWTKPLPSIAGETRRFWEACRQGKLLVQKCPSCDKFQWYPRGICANCWATEVEWVESSGKGTIWTFTLTSQNRTPGFADDVPYVVALVELEEGVRMFCNIVECPPRDVSIGMPVEVTFVRATDQISIPYFKPATG
ncbi:MAG: Zn-ribbon domain-containing OB-fold protein [Dehalococcoidia bacterium]|nr:Zn-ribbon domain-containing OB-fold protein [Dehalococcoidia bacterium]